MKNVVVPELGEGIMTASISFWFYKTGDPVKEKDDLVEMTTDKAAFNLPSPATGTLTQILFKEGQQVAVGDVIAVIAEN